MYLSPCFSSISAVISLNNDPSDSVYNILSIVYSDMIDKVIIPGHNNFVVAIYINVLV